jgi:hypothetical protein
MHNGHISCVKKRTDKITFASHKQIELASFIDATCLSGTHRRSEQYVTRHLAQTRRFDWGKKRQTFKAKRCGFRNWWQKGRTSGSGRLNVGPSVRIGNKQWIDFLFQFPKVQIHWWLSMVTGQLVPTDQKQQVVVRETSPRGQCEKQWKVVLIPAAGFDDDDTGHAAWFHSAHWLNECLVWTKSAFRSGWLNLINGRVTSRLIRLSGLGASQQQMPVESQSCLELVPDQSWGIATLKNWQPSQIPIPVYQNFRQEGGRSECP